MRIFECKCADIKFTLGKKKRKKKGQKPVCFLWEVGI